MWRGVFVFKPSHALVGFLSSSWNAREGCATRAKYMAHESSHACINSVTLRRSDHFPKTKAAVLPWERREGVGFLGRATKYGSTVGSIYAPEYVSQLGRVDGHIRQGLQRTACSLKKESSIWRPASCDQCYGLAVHLVL